MNRENINPDLVDDALRKANGNYNVVLTMLDNDEQEFLYFELFTTFMRHCFQRKIVEINELTDQFVSLGREKQKQFLSYSLRLVRENFMLNLEKEELSYMSRKEEEFSRKFNSYIHSANVFDIVEQLTLAHNHIEANGNPRIIFMDLAIQIIILLKMEPDMA
jgi:DNA polymerase-3 subunit delta'